MTNVLNSIQAIEPHQVQQVYSGRLGCACGCRGKYSVQACYAKEADKERGYRKDPAKTTRSITHVLRLMQNAPFGTVEYLGNGLYYHDNGSRVYSLKLAKAYRTDEAS